MIQFFSKIFSLLFVIMCIFSKSFANSSGDIYSSCVFSYQNNFISNTITGLPESFIIRPVGKICRDLCQFECGALFGIATNGKSILNKINNFNNVKSNGDSPKKEAKTITSDFSDVKTMISNLQKANFTSIEINQDLIQECIISCQSGEIYSTSIIREPSSNSLSPSPFTVTQLQNPISIKNACSTNSDANFIQETSAAYPYNTEILVFSDIGANTVTLTLTNKSDDSELNDITGNNLQNAVALCGFRTVLIFPQYNQSANMYNYSTNPSGWPSGIGINTPTEQPKNSDTTFGVQMGYDPSLWMARNYSWTDTGIDIIDGDFLSIQYYGRYHNYCNLLNSPCINVNSQYNLFLGPIGNSSDTTEYQNQWLNGFSSGSSNDDSAILLTPEVDNSSAANYLQQNPAKTSNLPTSNTSSSESSLAIMKNNLKGTMFISSSPTFFSQDISLSNAQQTYGVGTINNSSDLSSNFTEYGFNPNAFQNISYSGIISNYSTQYSRLGIKHYDDDNGGNQIYNWADNTGGYNVIINWYGCLYDNGEMLQYGFVPASYIGNFDNSNLEYYIANTIEWINIDFNPSDNTFTIDTSGALSESNGGSYLFLRIAPQNTSIIPPQPTSGNSSIYGSTYNNVLNNYNLAQFKANTAGYYSVSIQKTQSYSDGGVICKLFALFEKNMFGNPANHEYGLVGSIHKYTLSNSLITNTLTAVFTLYFVILGFMIFSGMVQMKNEDLVFSIVKVSFIGTMLTAGSSDYFYEMIADFFTIGVEKVINNVSYYGDGLKQLPSSACDSGIILINSFDWIVGRILNEVFSVKLLSLLYNGLTSFITGLLIVVGFCIYIISLCRAIIVYAYSILGMGLMFIIAPIMIPMSLFDFTFGIFDAWVKQMISFALQPIFVFSTLSIFQFLMFFLFDVAFGFTVCKNCAIDIGFCIWHNYVPLLQAHYPPVSFAPSILMISSAICVVVVGQGMNVTIGFMSDLSAKIVNFYAVKLGGLGSVRDFFRPGYDAVALSTKEVMSIATIIPRMIGMDAKSEKYSKIQKQEKDDKNGK